MGAIMVAFRSGLVVEGMRVLCERYWQLEPGKPNAIPAFAYTPEELARWYGAESTADVIALVATHCLAHTTCQKCETIVALLSRESFVDLHRIKNIFTEVHCQRLCSECSMDSGPRPSKLLEDFTKPRPVTDINAPVWPLDENGRRKSHYYKAKRLLPLDQERRQYFEKIKATYANIALGVNVASIVPDDWVKDMLTPEKPGYNKFNMMANQFHFVIYNTEPRPVVAIDCCQEENHKTRFKRHMLAQVQVPYLLLPRDEELLFSEKMRELVEKSAYDVADPLSLGSITLTSRKDTPQAGDTEESLGNPSKKDEQEPDPKDDNFTKG